MSDSGYHEISTTNDIPSSDCHCSAPWFWIILFVVALLVIIGLVVAVIYGFRRVTKGQDIEFKGAVIKTASDTAITATWPASKHKNDKVTLWASLDPPIINNVAEVTNQKANNVATAGATSVTLDGLQPGLKYYATVTVSNSETFNYKNYTQLVFLDSSTPKSSVTNNASPPENVNNYFALDHILQVGRIQLDPTNNTVRFNQTPREVGSLWYVNSNSQIISEAGEMCLINDSGTLSAKLLAETTTAVDVGNSKWAYGQGTSANQWCLSNTVGNANPTCMSLTGITNGTATIAVTSQTTPGDAWVNAYEVHGGNAQT